MSDFLRANLPLGIVILISLITGFLMVLIFRYASDQKAIHIAKDQLKAHLLAVRLFQDQLSVVLVSYGRILRGTGRYLRLTFKPLLLAIVPLILLITQLDYYLGMVSINRGQAFLIQANVSKRDTLEEVSLDLPPGLTATAPPVHVPAANQVFWRIVASKEGHYDANIKIDDQSFAKQVIVSRELARLSPVRLRGSFWKRLFTSAEPALPENSTIQSIAVQYPERVINFAWLQWNWIWLFFVLSMAAGFLFKSLLGIEI
jgi:hypothetical protein